MRLKGEMVIELTDGNTGERPYGKGIWLRMR